MIVDWQWRPSGYDNGLAMVSLSVGPLSVYARLGSFITVQKPHRDANTKVKSWCIGNAPMTENY